MPKELKKQIHPQNKGVRLRKSVKVYVDSSRLKNTKKYRKELKKIISSLNCLSKNNEVPLHIAEIFIKSSTWWFKHPSGRPVRAPNHQKNIYSSKSGWSINFGWNTFLISKAILRCRKTLEEFLAKADDDKIEPFHSLCRKLRLDICGAVEIQGKEYPGYYPLESHDDMVFGSSSISTRDFIILLIGWVPVKKLYYNLTVDDISMAKLLETA